MVVPITLPPLLKFLCLFILTITYLVCMCVCVHACVKEVAMVSVEVKGHLA